MLVSAFDQMCCLQKCDELDTARVGVSHILFLRVGDKIEREISASVRVSWNVHIKKV